MRFDLDLLARGDPISDAVGEVARKEALRSLDRFGIGVECEHGRCLRRDADRQPAVAAAQLEHTLAAKVCEAAQRGQMRSLWIERAREWVAGLHRLFLYALTVVPRAPNFSALRRVSSNFERA